MRMMMGMLFMYVTLSMGANSQDHNSTQGSMTKFQKRAILVKTENLLREEEERKLEEEGFCACSVQRP